MKPFFSKQTWIIWITALTLLAGLGAAMFAYTGPQPYADRSGYRL